MTDIFDPHIHIDTRNCNDYEGLALAGVNTIMVPCSPTHERRYCVRSFAERFDRIVLTERRRGAAFGVEVLAALAVNAADVGDFDVALAALPELERRLDLEPVMAIGELVLRDFTAAEIELFDAQLRLAGERDVPVLIEGPIELDCFRRMLRELARGLDMGWLRPERVCVVDLDQDKFVLARALGLGGYGIPVSPRFDGPFCVRRKLDDRELRELLELHGCEGVMINSGLHYGFADPLCLPKTVLRLRLAGLDADTLRRISHDNALAFLARAAA